MQSYFQKFTAITNKWIGKRCDRDGVYGAQCVDWIKQYAEESGYPVTTSWNAIDLWSKWLWDHYTKTPYKSGLFPQAGDIVIQSWPTQYWHIFVADVSNPTNLLAIEQNAQTWNGSGKGGDAIRKHTYTYKNCLGWFTHK